jgi:hypothetical protein
LLAQRPKPKHALWHSAPANKNAKLDRSGARFAAVR